MYPFLCENLMNLENATPDVTFVSDVDTTMPILTHPKPHR